jgi:hypothetical protein
MSGKFSTTIDAMPAKLLKKKKRKPVRYKTITITVTAKQKKSLVNFCRSRKTTPAKIIKKAIRPLITDYADLKVTVNNEKVNQLQLF